MPKLKKPKLPNQSKAALQTSQKAEEKVTEALSDVPRITSDTVEEHREEVLSSARKYIYPLQHSKHHVVRNSIPAVLLQLYGFLRASAASAV